MALPAFKITRADGTSYETSMAEGVTLEMARAYFLGSIQVEENFETGEETKTTVTEVLQIKS